MPVVSQWAPHGSYGPKADGTAKQLPRKVLGPQPGKSGFWPYGHLTMALLGVVSVRGARCQPPSQCSVVQALSVRSQAMSLSCCVGVLSLRFICNGEIGVSWCCFCKV